MSVPTGRLTLWMKRKAYIIQHSLRVLACPYWSPKRQLWNFITALLKICWSWNMSSMSWETIWLQWTHRERRLLLGIGKIRIMNDLVMLICKVSLMKQWIKLLVMTMTILGKINKYLINNLNQFSWRSWTFEWSIRNCNKYIRERTNLYH